MLCPRCGYITFDFYENCPKCKANFTKIKQELNIIDYSISEENSYLIPAKLEIKKEETEKKEPEIEHTSFQKEKEEIEAIDISEYLETTKLEEEK